jgi:hypothetical protein
MFSSLGQPEGVLSSAISTATEVTKIAAAFGLLSVSTIGCEIPGTSPVTSPGDLERSRLPAVELSPEPDTAA